MGSSGIHGIEESERNVLKYTCLMPASLDMDPKVLCLSSGFSVRSVFGQVF